VDLYLLHDTTSLVAVETWMAATAETVRAGLAGVVGVSSFGTGQQRRADDALASWDIPLACNQVELSLLDRYAEREGLLEACRELGVTLITYRPLALGLLLGTDPGAAHLRGRRGPPFGGGYRRKIAPFSGLLRGIGRAHGDRTSSQVVLNWAICKGALSIPGAGNAEHIRENAGAMGWRLTDREAAALDAAGEGL
jgi:aryl-alcohol dehydrogenase-like predicted oxidoreductase